jgi:hypothetical protein
VTWVTCQCCAGTGKVEVADGLEEIRRECREKSIALLPGDRVRLRDAAKLVGIEYKTLRNWRSERDIPLGETEVDGTVTYSLTDIERLRGTRQGHVLPAR